MSVAKSGIAWQALPPAFVPSAGTFDRDNEVNKRDE
jgi:hypothetical protein